jgi:hypothetical protein
MWARDVQIIRQGVEKEKKEQQEKQRTCTPHYVDVSVEADDCLVVARPVRARSNVKSDARMVARNIVRDRWIALLPHVEDAQVGRAHTYEKTTEVVEKSITQRKKMSTVRTPMQVDHVQAFEGPIKAERAIRPHRSPELLRVARRMDPNRINFCPEPPTISTK